MLNIIVESAFIGLYCASLYFTVNQSFFPLLSGNRNNIYVTFFIVGFIKHFIGYLVGIQTTYCRQNGKTYVKSPNLFIESLLEGCAFLTFGAIGILCWPGGEHHLFLLYFIMGAAIHMLAEITGIHKYFIAHNCRK